MTTTTTTKTIEIDGQKFNIDLEKAKELGLITPIIRRFKGQHYSLGGDLYVLALVDVVDNRNKMALINIHDGSRYTEVVAVEKILNITNEEWYLLTGGRDDFFLVTIFVKAIAENAGNT